MGQLDLQQEIPFLQETSRPAMKLSGNSWQTEEKRELLAPEQLTAPSSKCPYQKCDGSGIILIEYPSGGYEKGYGYAHTVAHKCECSGKASAGFRRARSMIPFEFIDAKGKDFDWTLYETNVALQKKIINAFVTKYKEFEKKSKGLYLYSKTKGSGKTMLACCLANEILETINMSVKFVTALDYIELVKSTYESKEYKEELRSLYSARLLILDDIGVEAKNSRNEHTDMMLYKLINDRVSDKLMTIITSNVRLDDLKTDERTVDRIRKMSIVVNIPEVPVRMKLAESENVDFLSSII